MVSAYLYVEGGGSGADSKELDIRCREGFRKLLEKCGFGQQRRMPRLFACGGRAAVFDDFVTAHANNRAGAYVAMWLDSEEPMENVEEAWKHLQNVQSVPQWAQPEGAIDDQVLFMTTCMETWIVADRLTLKEHYGSKLQESGLPSLVDLERRLRHDVQEKLVRATRVCSNAYAKGKRSFELLGKLTPATLEKHLPSFVRVRRILSERL
ncbi:MAG: DUF4276 family protein [Verrucomicrobia bacterium]|nr:DUF4276 family protein [Verrucomicrobiota bacterium]